jgi:hypothetical protein
MTSPPSDLLAEAHASLQTILDETMAIREESRRLRSGQQSVDPSVVADRLDLVAAQIRLYARRAGMRFSEVTGAV